MAKGRESLRSRERDCMCRIQVMVRGRKEDLGPSGPDSTDLLSHKKDRGPRFFKAVIFNLYSQELRGRSGE